LDGAKVEPSVAAIPIPGQALGAHVGLSTTTGLPFALRHFIAGDENRLVEVAMQRALEGPSNCYSPLVLLGPSGTGKTHLARGVALRWKQQHKSETVIYVTGSDFARELAMAISGGSTDVFRLRYRNTSLLVIDEIAPLAKKAAAQQELIATLDALQDVASVILTSTATLAELRPMAPAVISRLTSGLVISLSPPGVAAREELVERLANDLDIPADPQAIRMLAKELPVGAAELREVLVAVHKCFGALDTASLRKYLSAREAGQEPTLREITAASVRHFSLTMTQLKSASRNRTIVNARSVAMYLSRQLTSTSMEKIGRAFGGRDHTTVLHSCRKIEKLMRTDPETQATVAKLRRLLSP
jgi:chromosomal replication initiator protein